MSTLTKQQIEQASGRELDANRPTVAAVQTWYRAASCYGDIKPIHAEKRPKDEADGRVRFFADEQSARDWVVITITAEQNRLDAIRAKITEPARQP